MAFPTLSVNQDNRFGYQKEDTTIRSQFEGGYELTRPRHSRRRKIWDLKYSTLPEADKLLIDAFIETVSGGADSFDWTNPEDNQTYTVRFGKIPVFIHLKYELWSCDFQLREV